MAKVSLIDIANSGASVEAIIELMAKNIEKRLQALESNKGMDYESKVEQMLSGVIENMSKMSPTINVPQAAVPKVVVDSPIVNMPAPVVNIPAPVINIPPQEPSTVVAAAPVKYWRCNVERDVNGLIDSFVLEAKA